MFWDKVLLFLLLLLPSQFGRHFWLKQSLLFGIKVDYLSPTVFLQDILILIILLNWFFKHRSIFFTKRRRLFFSIYLLFAIVNIVFAFNPLVAAFSWLRITEMLFLGFFVYLNSKTVLGLLFSVLPVIVIFESLLGIAQTITQSSIGGLLWFLGERTFNIYSPGIARASWLGQIFLRPYGTFSHPNSLAGFVLVCLILIQGKRKMSFFSKLSVFLGLILITLAFSRTVWLTVCIISFIFVLYRLIRGFPNTKTKFDFPYLAAVLVLPVVGFLFSRTSIEAASISNRIQLAQIALSLIENHPWLGVGSGNFIIALSQTSFNWSWLYWLQPVHNIFLLAAAEVGLPFLAVIIVFLLWNFRSLFRYSLSLSPVQTAFLISLAVISITGFFDHYWLTLIQNQLLLVLVFSLSVSFFDDTIEFDEKRTDFSEKVTGGH